MVVIGYHHTYSPQGPPQPGGRGGGRSSYSKDIQPHNISMGHGKYKYICTCMYIYKCTCIYGTLIYLWDIDISMGH